MAKKTTHPDVKARTRHLTLLLIRKEFKSPEDALKNPDLLERLPLPKGFGFGGSLYLLKPPPKEPRWAPFLKEGFAEARFSMSATASAVLFITSGSRLFAATFGQGRHQLHHEAFELDFGLKVTLNSVDADKLRSLDVRTIEEVTVHTRRQVSRSSALDAFNVDIQRDLLGSVTGEPSDASLAKRLTGRDSLSLTAALKFPELADKCATLLAQYESAWYKERFSWVDNIRLVRDSKTLGALNDKLVQAINDRDTGKIHLAPPEVIEWEGVSFLYPGESHGASEAHPDLDLNACLAALATREGVEPGTFTLSLDTLRREKIRTVHDDEVVRAGQWSLYSCLVVEMPEEEALYILSAGQWFKIEKTFAAQTLEETRRLVRQVDHLPLADSQDDEGVYNQKAAGSFEHLALLDKKNKKAKGARTAIEPCDLFSGSGQFIHVKRKLRSAALSHLFAQGAVAAETFLRDEKFRKEVKKVLEAQNPELAKRIGNPKDRPDPSQYEVVFAIITPPTKEKWPQALPFFSQLNLVRTASRLSLLGFRVALHRIELAVTAT
jgi:uncharacterized protein (TIGR04141 family)